MISLINYKGCSEIILASIEELLTQNEVNDNSLSWLVMILGYIIENTGIEIHKKIQTTENHLDDKDYLLKFRDQIIEINALNSKIVFKLS